MAWYDEVQVVESPEPWHAQVPVVDPAEEPAEDPGLLDRLASGPGEWLARNNPWAMGNRERYGDALVDMAAQGAEDVREADWGQIGREALEAVEGVSARAVGGRARPSADVAASDLGRSFTGAAAQGLGGTAEGLDTLGRSAWWLGTGDVVDPTLLGRAGAAVSGLAETEALTPERPEHFASQFGGAGGSMTTFLGTGLLGRAGAAGLASRLGASGQTASRAGQAGQFGAAGTMAGSLGAQEAHDRVRQFMAENPELGMTEEDALRMAPQGVLPGLVQVANLNILLRPLSGWAKKSVAKKVTQDLLAAGASEFTVESAGAVLQNAVERQYNVDRELMDGALAQGGYAALSAIALRTGALPYTTRQESGPELVRDTVRRLAEGENPQTVVAEIVNEVNPDTVAEADRAGAFDIDFGQIGQLTDERGFVYDTTADGLPVAGRPVQEEQAWAEQRESDRLDAELRREFDWQRAEEQRVRERGRQEREADYQRQLQPDPTGRFASGVDAERGRPRGDLPENPAMREAFAAALQGPPEFASGFLAADQQMRGQESAGVEAAPTPRPGPETASPASPESQNLRFRPDGNPYRTERGVRNAIAREGLAAEPVEVPDGWAINLAETDSQNRETDRQNQFSQTAPEVATDPVATEGLPRIRQDGQWLPFPDARLKRREYRQALARMPTELTRGGGIALVPRQGAQRSHRGMPTGDITWDYDAQDLVRTPSVNPGWFQSLAAEENVTVADIGRIVDKALAGENLGVRQQRVVEALLNNVWAGRVTDGGADQGFGPDFESLGERLSAARDLRRAARGEPTDAEADAEAQRQQAESDEMAGMRYAEEVYLADMDAEARALYELAEDARAQDEAATMEALDREQSDIELARELWNISQGARDDTEATTRTGQEEPGTQPRQGTAAARESEEPVPATEPAGRTEPEQQDLTGEAAPTESQQALERRRRETEERLRGRTDAAPDEGEGDLFTDPEFDSARRQQELAPDEAEPGETNPPARSRQAPQEAPAPAGVSRSGQDETIEDFGEKIAGARKDYAETLEDAAEQDLADVPLSKSWPHPNYQKLIDEGAEPKAVALVRALRDEVPTKPRRYVGRWVTEVSELRDFAIRLLREPRLVENFRSEAPRSLRNAYRLLGRADLYEEFGHEKSLKGIWFTENHYSLYRGEENVTKWVVERKAKANAFSNFPRELAVGDTREEALSKFREVYASLGDKQRGPVRFDIYSDRRTGDVFIGRKIGKNILRVRTGFENAPAARAYLRDNQPALEKRLAKMREIPPHRDKTNAPRVGEDHLGGREATPETWEEEFGFRGVQFGNWVEQSKRQDDLNNAYDALMDLAGVINVPARALSLNGDLGLAFGARGKGGKGAGAAHYEPDHVVINLTKKAGAGSLAHEWWHALDNHFGKRQGRTDYMTKAEQREAGDIRPEVRDAFNGVIRAIRNSGMPDRAQKLDEVRSKDYWSTAHELSARAFEGYVIEKLRDQQGANDYLANIVSEKAWEAMEGDTSRYPYPTAEEMPGIRAAFDQFFQTVETRQTDRGIELYSRTPQDAEGMAPDQATEALRGALSPRGFRNLVENGPVRVVSSPAEVPGTHPADAAGVAVDGQIYLVADNLRDPAHVRAVLLHELGVHHGLREMLGDDYGALIDQLRRQVERGGREGAGRAAREAWSAHQRALADDTIRDEDTRWEETVAYLAESGSDTPLLRRILAAIRNFLRRYGLVRKFTAADVAQIARGSVRRAARQEAPDQGAPVRGGQAAAALSRAPVKVPDRTWRWMGFDGPQRLVADFEHLAQRHPEHYETAGDVRSDVEFVMRNPDDWFPHADDRVMVVRKGNQLDVPAVRIDFRQTKDGALQVASVYRMTERGIISKMRDKRKKVDEALGGSSPASALPDRTSPGSLTIRDYLEAEANRSGRPESPSGDSASSEGTVPPEPDTGQGRYSRAVALDDVLGRVLTRRLERDGDASPEVFRDPARWRDRNVFNALRRARSHLKSTAGIVADDRVAAEFLAQAAEGRVGDALAGSGKVLAARDQAGELVGTAERTGQGFNLAVQHGLGVGFKSTRTLPGAKRALGGETTAESVFDPPIESGPLDLDGRSYLGEVGSWLRWKAQDKLNSLKRLQDAVEKRRGKLSESANAYVAEELYHGRARDRIDRFDDEHVDPLLRAVQESGYTLEQVEQYLYARHAPEANAKLAEINPGEDAMSGMSDAEAAEIMAGLREQGDFEALEAIGERVDAMNRATRELLVESGLETPETIQAWEGAYEFYVPLKGPPGGREAATGLPRRGRGYDTRGDASRRRLGRRSKARDILANVVAGHYSTVQRAEKARVGRALLEFARQNPDERLWTIDQPMTRRGIDPATGLVRNFGDPAQKQQDNVFVVREDGIEHHIVFNTENVDAMRIARAVKNLGADDMGIVTRGLLMFNRYLSMMSTSMNPEFVVSNFTRDLQTAFINLNDTEAAAMKGRVIRDVGKAFRAIRRHQKGKAETAWGRSYNEFRAEGGQTGWMEGYRDVSDLARSLTKKLDQHRPGSWGFARRAGRNVLEFVNNMNTAVENAVRLSAYHHARKSGVSRMKAASLAKNLTVNFNRKGDAGNVLNAFYLFYNAAVQGNARIIQAAARSPKARKFMYASVAFGAVLDMANRMYAGEDEDGENRYDQIPEWIKSMNWVVMMPPGESLPDWVPAWMRGDGNYLKIPLPYGYNVLNYAGQKVSRAAWSGQIPDYSPAREAGQLAMSITDAFNPIGASPSLLQLVSPTITDPAVQWAENKNFAGIPLHKEPSPFGPPPPNHTLHFNGARGWSRWITRNLNELTGGSEVTPGAVDINPELVDHLSDFLAGGAGRFTAETLDLPRKILSDEEVESHEIPFVGRLWGSPRTDASRSLFFERLRDLEYLDRELDLAQENREYERARELRREFRDEFRLIDQGKDYRRDAKELSDTIEALEQAEDRTEAQDRHLERLRERRDGIYSRFNRAYRDTVIEQ